MDAMCKKTPKQFLLDAIDDRVALRLRVKGKGKGGGASSSGGTEAAGSEPLEKFEEERGGLFII